MDTVGSVPSVLTREGLCIKFCGEEGDDLGEGQGELVDMDTFAEAAG